MVQQRSRTPHLGARMTSPPVTSTPFHTFRPSLRLPFSVKYKFLILIYLVSISGTNRFRFSVSIFEILRQVVMLLILSVFLISYLNYRRLIFVHYLHKLFISCSSCYFLNSQKRLREQSDYKCNDIKYSGNYFSIHARIQKCEGMCQCPETTRRRL